MNNDKLTRESFEDERNKHVLAHWHSQIEVIRIAEGCMGCTIDGADYSVGKDAICMINQKHPHRIYLQDKAGCTFQRVMVDPALFTADRDIYNRYIDPLLNDASFSHIIAKAGTPLAAEIANFMDGIEDMEKNQPDAYELGVVAVLHMMFQRIYSHYLTEAGKKKAPTNTDAMLHRRMADYIYQHYQEKVSLDDIAAHGNVSRSKCCSVFKEFAQTSPIDFLNLYRLEVSCNLLKNTDDSIASVAFACGFGQQSYYNRLFLREYGMTPKEYRASA